MQGSGRQKLKQKEQIISSVVLLILVFSFRGATIYLYGLLCTAFFIIRKQWTKQRFWKKEKQMLEQLEKYLGDVRHYYHSGGLVEDAIYDSLEEAPAEIAGQMNQIYDILAEGSREKELEYREQAPNRFLTTFLALCQITMEYGDSMREGQSLFLTNINHLREEIRIELLKKEKTAYVFSGLIWISLLPVFSLKIIENWGINNLPELEHYYHGAYGITVCGIIFLGTIGSCQLISSLREQKVFHRNHPLLIKLSEIPWIRSRIKSWIFRFPKKAETLNGLLQRGEADIRLPEFIIQSFCYGIGSTGIFGIMTAHAGLLKGIFAPYALLLGVLGGTIAGVTAFFMPRLFLNLRVFFGRREKEDEVLQFHSIILMLMYLKRMNVETILSWMENFSQKFKSSMEECVDSFPYDNEAALSLLKEREPFLPFVRLVEDLEACDRVGPLKAFDEVAGQRSYFLEKRKQDNEISISEKGAVARVVAYIPLVLTLLLYLIVPFVLESMVQLGGYMSEINGL